MLAIAVRRLASAAVTIFVVLTFVFVAARTTGDPARLLAPIDATPQQLHNLRVKLGEDRSPVIQYGIFLRNAVHGDFGRSLRWSQPALDLVLHRLPNSLLLGSTAFFFALLVSLPLGVLAAMRRGTSVDAGISVLTTLGQATPSLVLAVLLVWVFSIQLHILPVAGSGKWQNLVLPSIALAAYPVASQTRIIRSAVADTLRQDYVRTAHAKGLPPLQVLQRHTLRTALVPIITIFALQMGFFLGGAVVIETVFAWPGLGRLMIDAVSARDFPVIQSGTLVFATIFITINAVADTLYSAVDPRYRHSQAA